MAKALFIPVTVVGGFAGGMLARKVFEQIWTMVDDQEPPEPEHRDISLAKLMIAMALRGAILQVTRAGIEQVSRRGFYNVTGSWPGEERPEPE